MLRAGSVPYLVGRPLDAGLESLPGIELERCVPAELARRLGARTLDIALVSSIELFRQPGARYLDGIAVAGAGRVDSVQVFLRKDISAVRRIALDPASRAAATLVRVLLADREGGPPEYLEVPAGADPREADADAWLRIGDPALREAWLEGLPSFNPSEAWAKATALPFVFATWLVRAGVEPGDALAHFLASARHGQARIQELAAEGALALDLPKARLEHYLGEQCLYAPGKKMAEALRLFGQRASALGLCADQRPSAISASGGSRCRA